MAKPSAIDMLPDDVRDWIDAQIVANNFSQYEALQEVIRERGFSIGKSQIHRRGQAIERRMAAIKSSVEASKLIIQATGDDKDVMSESLIALIQSSMFETIINIQEATGDDELSDEDRLDRFSKASKSIADLSRASVNQKKWRLEVEAQVRQKLLAEQAEEIDRTVQSGGMNEEQALFWRKKFLGVQ